MAEKKVSTCCKREIAHKKDGTPYTHKCYALPEDPFTVPGQLPDNDPRAKRGAVDPFESPTKPLGKSPFDVPKDGPGPWFPAGFDSECDTCGGSVSAGDEIRADGQGGYECRANCEQDEQPHEDESPVAESGDHRKWCTRCKLLGHYAADCTTAVLEGGVVSVPTVVDNACSAADGYAPHVFEWNKWVSASQCVACGEDNPEQPEPDPFTVPSVAALVEAGARVREGLPYTEQPDPFTTPTQPVPEVNVSGQPKARYEWRGKQNYGYLVKLPETGDFRRYGNGKPKGLTRATTFNKAASDSNALSDWGKRNVLIGASLRPDLVAKAHGLNHETGKGDLMKLVAELETAAGAKVSADIGTLIHELTERWDAGVTTMAEIPVAYQPLIVLYTATLQEAGLRPVPGLIERTTYIPEFGGVVGTLDRVYYHEQSGQYVIGDVKTGKTLKYGMDEIETQEWIYAHGVNNAGVYDWNTDTWDKPWAGAGIPPEWSPLTSVSEEWGVVVHMPVQGDDAGTVQLKRADLQRGKRHAQVCHDVREERANKPKPEPWTGEEFAAPVPTGEVAAWLYWEDCFSRVPSQQSAGLLWDQARAAGVPPEEMEKLKELADKRLKALETPAQPLSWADQAERVLTKEDAQGVWERAYAAGVRNEELDSLVAIMQRELS